MSEEVLLQRAFPVIEGIPEQLFAELEEREYKDFIPAEKNLSYITTCEKVHRDILEEFQQEMFDGLAQFGYPYKELKQKDPDNAKIDRWIGKFLYEKMDITPSVAATLGMWQFMNLYMFPSVVYWRWGNAKHRYISSIRNYCGTMWWRQYFFTQSPDLEKMYMFLTEDEIVSLYERPRTRGLPDHVRNNVMWYREFCKKYDVKEKEFYRVVVKNYNAELGFRNYYALTREDLHQIYEQVFVSSLGMDPNDIQYSNISDESEDMKNDDQITEVKGDIQTVTVTPKKRVVLKRKKITEDETPASKSFSSEELEDEDSEFSTFRSSLKRFTESLEETKEIEEEVEETSNPPVGEAKPVTKRVFTLGKNNKVQSITTETQTDHGIVRETVKPGVSKPSSNYIFADSTVLIIRNPARKGIEITFEAIPRVAIKDAIKRIGFSYLSMERKWYAQETPELIEKLKVIFGF